MKMALMAIASVSCAIPVFAQWSGNTTYYNPNGSYGGSARATTFGNRSTTQHYGANGMPAGSSTTTTFGNRTTTTHYNQYGQPAGTTTRYNFGTQE